MCNLIFSQISQIFGEQYKESNTREYSKETEWISWVILFGFWQNYVMLEMAGDYYTLVIHRISAWKGSGWSSTPPFTLEETNSQKVSLPSQILSSRW